MENEFSFSENAIRSATENLSYSAEEEVTFTSYFKWYEDLYATDCTNWSDSKKFVFFWGNLTQMNTQNS